MAGWLVAALGLALFAIGLLAVLGRRGAHARPLGLALMVLGDLLLVICAVVCWGHLSLRAALIVLAALLPIEVLAAAYLGRRLPQVRTDERGADDDER